VRHIKNSSKKQELLVQFPIEYFLFFNIRNRQKS